MDRSMLAIAREIFARQMLAKAGIDEDERLLEAFATVAREDFLGPPPWRISNFGEYTEVFSADPVILYQDVLFALRADRRVNNGSPSLHARGIHKLALRRGDTVAHIGAGTGYYTALLSRIVGEGGRVIAVEFDGGLAERASSNLKPFPNVEVVAGNGWDWPREDVDAVYVNFATARPADPWVERLKHGGRLIFPLGVLARDREGNPRRHTSQSGFLLITRTNERYQATFLGPTSFVWSEGAEPASNEHQQRLAEAFRRGGARTITSLRWKTPASGEEWYSEESWGLGYCMFP